MRFITLISFFIANSFIQSMASPITNNIDSTTSTDTYTNTNIDSIKLAPIYTHATKDATHDYANTTIITKESLESRQAQSLREVFALDSSVSVGGASPTAQKLYIRGIEDRLYSVYIDGANQYGNIFHHQGNITIDPMMIKDIDISKGMPNAYLGLGALAGSIHIRTKDASDFLKEGQRYGALLGLGGYSNEGYRANLASFFASNHTDGLLWANWTNIIGFANGRGEWVPGSANDSKSWLIKLRQHLTQNDTLALTYSGITEASTAPFATNLALRNVSLFSHANANHTATLGFERALDASNPFATHIKSNIYVNHRSLALTPLNQASSFTQEHDEVSAKNISFSNVGYNLSLRHPLRALDVEYGLNYQGVFVSDVAAQASLINRAKEQGHVYGGFLSAKLWLGDAWLLHGQSRYDVFMYHDKNSQHHLTQGFSPAASITYLPTNNLHLRASYAMLTRGAMPGDATLLGDEDVLIATHLHKESIHNVELNADYHGQILQWRVAMYYSRLLDFINSYAQDISHDHIEEHGHNHGGLRTNMTSPIEIMGYEGGLGGVWKGFNALFSVAQNFPLYKGYLLQDTYELGAVSGMIYTLSLQYDMARLPIKIGWLSQFTRRVAYRGYDIYNDELGDIDKAGYSVHNVYATWEPRGSKNLTLRLSVNNIFNTFYIAQTSPFKNEAMMRLDANIRNAMPNPGIDARLEIRYQL